MANAIHKNQYTETTTGQWCQPTTVPFESLNEPGCYICNWSGHLLRVPEDGVAPGRSPLMSIVGCEPLFVTKISPNPYIPVTKARLLAANCDVAVNF
jgi:hypothetical protein